MAKSKSVFICQECGTNYPKWQGQCRECKAWNSLVEELDQQDQGRGWGLGEEVSQVANLGEASEEVVHFRWKTGLSELDRVLGNGLVPGSYTLLGGDPGIGKSTLLLQMAGGLSVEQKVLYVSGEESVQQSRLRAHRLGVKSDRVEVASESRLERILHLADTRKPHVLVVDSIQTVYLNEVSSAPGSVSQVRECAARLMGLAKNKGIAVFLIGHVTKDGNIAGPKVLEHMVDTVLSFEGDNNHQFRLLRALKNRFGATNELGVFSMQSSGLEPVENPSELFLEERGERLVGSAVYCAMEGTRPLLCEVQALCNISPMAMPRRTSLGVDTNRVHLIAAVLDKHLDLELAKNDIFVNVVGGLRLQEPSVDLAVTAALISSCNQLELDGKTAIFGEVGLTGEIRAASFVDERLRESKKLGFEKAILPFSNKKHLKNFREDIELVWVKSLIDLPKALS